eukprot:11188832-Lingulodinium_polyedra.AAC.1
MCGRTQGGHAKRYEAREAVRRGGLCGLLVRSPRHCAGRAVCRVARHEGRAPLGLRAAATACAATPA